MTTGPEGNGSGSPRAHRDRGRLLLLFVVIAVATVLIMAFVSFPIWIGHTIAAIAGLVFLALVIITGASMRGRIPLLLNRHTHRIHRIAGTCFSGFVVGSFLLGLLMMLIHRQPVLTTTHGIVGLIVAVLAGAQFLLRMIGNGGPALRTIHTAIGYLIVPLYLFQIYLGLDIADFFESGGD